VTMLAQEQEHSDMVSTQKMKWNRTGTL